LSVGMESTAWAVLSIGAALYVSWLIFGGDVQKALYGISLCGMGMLTTTGIVVSMDTFGPVSDNANGIGEMAGLPKPARKIMADLDAVGNTTKAITKGFAIASAVVAAVSLFGSYVESTHLATISISNPLVFIGNLIGGAVPFLFSSLLIKS